MKRTYHHGDLRSALLRAAEDELADRGIESFSLRSVAKRAGVSHAAPAHHFKDANGLLTALAAIGYERLIETQQQRRRDFDQSSDMQMVASGLGYVDFALANPALFRLMFASDKPDRDDPVFAKVSVAAFDDLVAGIQGMVDADPYSDKHAMTDVMAAWSMVHGIAELMISGRFERPMTISSMSQSDRDKMLIDMFLRSYPKR